MEDTDGTYVCRGCGGASFDSLESFGRFPYANIFPLQSQEVLDQHPLTVIVCRDCSLAQLDHFPDEASLYRDYIWTTRTSSSIDHYLHELLEKLAPQRSSDTALEIASNDGSFASMLRTRFDNVYAIDPAENLTTQSNYSDVTIFCGLFSHELLKAHPELRGQFKLIVARNVVAHVRSIRDFLRSARLCLCPGGRIYLEFHDADALVDLLQFDSVYHEHQSFISLSSISRIANLVGLKVVSTWLGPIGGGSRSVLLESSTCALPRDVESIVSPKLDDWIDFRKAVDEYRLELVSILSDLRRDPSLTIVGYGASARSTTLLNFCDVAPFLNHMFDLAKVKHGRLWTGSTLVIRDPHTFDWTAVDVVVVFAWNFFDEIAAFLRGLGFKGRFLKVLPNRPALL